MKDSQVKVKLKNHPYNIIISNDRNKLIANFKKLKGVEKIFIITDDAVEPLYLKDLQKLLKGAGFIINSAVIRAGEKSKDIKNLQKLYEAALESSIDRKSCALALGGGVVGDLAGFFASTYMRGIKFVQMPTTLLAMADSAVGGKTAITTGNAKNIAGTFKQPDFVFIDTTFLSSLPLRQMQNGMAEVFKYAFILDRDFYIWFMRFFQKENNLSKMDFNYVVFKCCSFKAEIVCKDEKDINGIREILNFGHTLGHAIETYFNYEKFLHGEGVAIGMLFGGYLSDIVYKKNTIYKSIKELLSFVFADFHVGKISSGKIIEIMKKDKKTFNHQIRFVLLKAIGKAKSGQNIEDKVLQKYLDKFLMEIE
ncbi:MAG: 3-dehydroquinate synthase [Elusimicrobiota bacterium]|jgi:3-dehydroquinate synthase|nr:3-dehydroquinate synthase [Elusimicrobiota bacterium]